MAGRRLGRSCWDTLEDYRAFALTAWRPACESYALLDQTAVAARFGAAESEALAGALAGRWDVPGGGG